MLLRALLILALAFPAFAAEPNPVLETLLTQGIAVSKGPTLKLPAPSMADGLAAESQGRVLQVIAGERPVAALLRKGVSAPVIFESGDVEASTAAGGTGKFVNFWFVVYADLKKVADEGLWRGQEGAENPDEAPNPNDAKFSGKLLEHAELRSRQIEPILSSQIVENFASFDVQLFNRVRVQGVTRAIQTRSPESATYAAILDPRFAADAEYPNRWQSLSRDDAGKLQSGPWKRYQVFGAYAKATELKDSAGAVLVEYHMVFDEPEGWFHGANVIRSKLPMIVQSNVKKLRRRLAEKQAGS